ncbi:DUF3135 domain-containing protein [Vibrio salinus]|uniref:DUF3135 domain-containing protein n=1 Tax=Vibrio salinus TaxID=2899784 RepID=UPI001E59A022|nr:DUF3135 domain-containing protein [Vibrio salinus]MCE0493934.1 DUF3135 domain-containing protein [Vibrio salinus]
MEALPSFDELMDLAKENPEAFDILKQDICEEAIMCSSDIMRDRLWAQQSYIDRLVDSCKNPLHSNIKLMQELATQMHKFQFALIKTTDEEPQSAEIIPLDRYRRA